MVWYRKLGFTFGEPWDGFYAIGTLDFAQGVGRRAPDLDVGVAQHVDQPARGTCILDFAEGVRLDGLELHLKEAPKNDAERRHRREHAHLDAAAGVNGIEAFYAECISAGVRILRPLTATPWGTCDFYVEDPDGYIIAFGGKASSAHE